MIRNPGHSLEDLQLLNFSRTDPNRNCFKSVCTDSSVITGFGRRSMVPESGPIHGVHDIAEVLPITVLLDHKWSRETPPLFPNKRVPCGSQEALDEVREAGGHTGQTGLTAQRRHTDAWITQNMTRLSCGYRCYALHCYYACWILFRMYIYIQLYVYIGTCFTEQMQRALAAISCPRKHQRMPNGDQICSVFVDISAVNRARRKLQSLSLLYIKK